jgi:hypothetical protein
MSGADAARELAVILDSLSRYSDKYGRSAYQDLFVYEDIERAIENNTEDYGGNYTCTTDTAGAMEKIIDAGLRPLQVDQRMLNNFWDCVYDMTVDALVDSGVLVEVTESHEADAQG